MRQGSRLSSLAYKSSLETVAVAVVVEPAAVPVEPVERPTAVVACWQPSQRDHCYDDEYECAGSSCHFARIALDSC